MSMFVQPSEDDDEAAGVPVPDGLKDLDRPVADGLRHPPDIAADEIHGRQMDASRTATDLYEAEMSRHVHPAPVEGPKQVIRMILGEMILAMKNPG